jgi:pimeloyl-ACP methyl ester carboxylesterase
MDTRPGVRLDDRELIRRQLRAARRTLLRPRAYAGAAREMALAAFHVATYPLGLVPSVQPVRMPFASRRRPVDGFASTAAGWSTTPVLLVHGYFHNHSAFLVMAGALRRAGFAHVHGLNYNPLRAGIPEIAEMLALEVDRVLAATGAPRFVIIGHSMGGIVARYYAQELAEPGTVDTVVTLGSPHRGTYTAHLGPGPAARQLRPRSALLRRLEEGARPSDTRWIAYYSDLDAMVTPAVSAKIVHPALNATNIRLHDTGHLSLLLSWEAMRSIVEHFAGRAPYPIAGERPHLRLVREGDQEAG